jgi:hypothetical protein
MDFVLRASDLVQYNPWFIEQDCDTVARYPKQTQAT